MTTIMRIIVSWTNPAVFSGCFFLIPAVYAAQCQSGSSPTPIPSTLILAKAMAHRLQATYLEPNGQYADTIDALWTGANTVEDIHNLMLATGTYEFDGAAEKSYIGKVAHDPPTNWRDVFGGDNGGMGWFVLALSKIADYQKIRGRDNLVYINCAKELYSIMESQWDDTCGGGIWWTVDQTYKNTNTNHLFLLVSADGFLRFREQKYLDNAQKAWKWLSSSELRNADGLWYDGLDSSNSTTDPKSCPAGDPIFWTYNQGVIASGLAALSVATGDTSLLDQAEITLDATMKHLTANNILKEGCDEINSYCSTNSLIFKGVWTKHLRYYLNYANSTARTKKYSAFLQAQSAAVGRATTAEGDISSVWWEPGKNGSQYTPQSAAGGLAAHIAAAIPSCGDTGFTSSSVPSPMTIGPSSSSNTNSIARPDIQTTSPPDFRGKPSSRTIVGVSVGVPIAVIFLILSVVLIVRKRSTSQAPKKPTNVADPYRKFPHVIPAPASTSPPPYTKGGIQMPRLNREQ